MLRDQNITVFQWRRWTCFLLHPKNRLNHQLRSQIFLIRVVFVRLRWFKSSGRYRVSMENLIKIPQKSRISSTPLAELVGKHVGVVIPQDMKKSSRVCAKCALKIRNASTICEFIKAALYSENTTYVESGGDPRFKRLNVISPPRNVKKSRPYS